MLMLDATITTSCDCVACTASGGEHIGGDPSCLAWRQRFLAGMQRRRHSRRGRGDALMPAERELIVAQILANPDQRYIDIAQDWLTSEDTIGRIARNAGIRRYNTPVHEHTQQRARLAA